MVLRRVTEHVKAQNWTAVFLDFVIVVLGVFLGLQAQQWQEHRADRARERDYLQRLSSDFTAIGEQLRQCLDVYRDSVEGISVVSRLIEHRETSGAADETGVAGALIRMTAGAAPAGRSATFIEMVSSGELGILRDDAVRDALIAYDQLTQVNREIWRSIEDDAMDYQRPLYENIELEIDLESETYARLKSHDLDAMAGDPGFRAMLNMLAGAKANNYELCRQQAELAAAVRAQLD